TAHTADLLAALAGNTLLTKQDQGIVLKAVAARLATANSVYIYGEQDRLANVIAVMATRSDFDLDGFQSWLAEMDAVDRTVWKNSPPEVLALTRFQNNSYLLRALVPQLLERPSNAASLEVQKAVLKVLQRR